MMRIERKKLSELSASQIEEINLFLESNYSTVFHEPRFNSIVSEVFMTKFWYNFVYSSDGRIIALCPFHSKEHGWLRRTYSNPAMYDVRYGGWVYDRSELSLQYLLTHTGVSSNESLTYWSIPQIEYNDYGSVKGFTEFRTGLIDLSFSLEDILHKSISRKRRETINSAFRKGVVVEELERDRLGIFIDQCSYLKKSIGGQGFPRDYFVKIFDNYISDDRVSVLASKLGSASLATGMMICNKNMAHLWIAGKPRETHVNVPRQDPARFKFGFTKLIVPFYLHVKKGFGFRIVARARKMGLV